MKTFRDIFNPRSYTRLSCGLKVSARGNHQCIAIFNEPQPHKPLMYCFLFCAEFFKFSDLLLQMLHAFMYFAAATRRQEHEQHETYPGSNGKKHELSPLSVIKPTQMGSGCKRNGYQESYTGNNLTPTKLGG